MSKVKLIWITHEAERHIAYNARISNPNRDFGSDSIKLLNYCKSKEHWSIFEQANACFEIETTRAISAQIIRHKSFSFQEFSQRYSKAQNFEYSEARLQDSKNKQNSLPCEDKELLYWWYESKVLAFEYLQNLYNQALEKGIAKEVARNILPLATTTKIAMNGSIRSWIHYLDVRTKEDTQLEHRLIALEIQAILKEKLPNIFGD